MSTLLPLLNIKSNQIKSYHITSYHIISLCTESYHFVSYHISHIAKLLYWQQLAKSRHTTTTVVIIIIMPMSKQQPITSSRRSGLRDSPLNAAWCFWFPPELRRTSYSRYLVSLLSWAPDNARERGRERETTL